MKSDNQSQIKKLLDEVSAKPVTRVLFVCLGNICRSPAAEGVMKATVEKRGESSEWIIDSAGTGDYHIGNLPDRRMRSHAGRRGLDLTHRCRQAKRSDFDDFDIIVAMDGSNLRNLQRLAPTQQARDKIVLMSDFFNGDNRRNEVPDPYYEGSEAFELVLDLLEEATANLAEAVAAKRL